MCFAEWVSVQSIKADANLLPTQENPMPANHQSQQDPQGQQGSQQQEQGQSGQKQHGQDLNQGQDKGQNAGRSPGQRSDQGGQREQSNPGGSDQQGRKEINPSQQQDGPHPGAQGGGTRQPMDDNAR